MLFQLGPVTVDCPGPFNATDTSEEFGADYAVKPVVGAPQPREFVGPADTRFTLTGKLFPQFFARNGQTTGLSEIEALRAVTASGEPQILVRGDGTNLGWYLVEKVTQKSAYLDENGVGQEITFDITLVQSPTAASAASVLGLLNDLTDTLANVANTAVGAFTSLFS